MLSCFVCIWLANADNVIGNNLGFNGKPRPSSEQSTHVSRVSLCQRGLQRKDVFTENAFVSLGGGKLSGCWGDTACTLRQDVTNVSHVSSDLILYLLEMLEGEMSTLQIPSWARSLPLLSSPLELETMTLKWQYSISLSGLFHLTLTTKTFKWARWWVAGKMENRKSIFLSPPRLIRYTNDNIYWQGLYANIGPGPICPPQ